MLLFQFILLIIYIITSFKIRNYILRDCIFFFTVLYGLQLFIAIWDPYEMHTIRISTIIMFNLQLIFFVIGAIITEKKIRSRSRTSFAASQCRSLLPFCWPKIKTNNLLIFLVLFFLCYSFYNYSRMQAYVSTLELVKEGRDYYYNAFFPSYTLKMVDSIITSIKIPFLVIALNMTFSGGLNSWKKWFVIVGTLAACYFNSMTTMGRGDIMVVLFVFFMFCFFSRHYYPQKFKRRILPISLIFLSVVIISLVATSLIRFNVEIGDVDVDAAAQVLLEPFATYFYGPICAFDFGVTHTLVYPHPFFGFAVFAGFWDFFLIPFQILTPAASALSMNDILGSKMSEFFYFPGGQDWNALFTGCINYYLDFNFIGFIIYPFLHGLLFAKLVYKNSVSSFFLLAIMFNLSYMHIVSCGVQSVSIVFTLLWTSYICKTLIVTNK